MTQTFDYIALCEAVREYEGLTFYQISPSELVFEERVKLNCFYCKNYNLNWKCPPRIPDIDYRQIIMEYDNGLFVKIELPFSESNFSDVRARSTNDLHRALLKMEQCLWEHNYPLAKSFIGGSCKLCKNGCGQDRCNNPYLARIPMEATGINVIKSAEKYGIHLKFPPKDSLTRLGMLLW